MLSDMMLSGLKEILPHTLLPVLTSLQPKSCLANQIITSSSFLHIEDYERMYSEVGTK